MALDFALVGVFPSQLVEVHHTHYPSLDASCTSGIQLGIYMCICLALHNMRTYPTSFWMCMCVSVLQFRDTIPGPGSYGKGGDPWSQLEERYQRSPGTVGMLDNGGVVLRKLPTTVSGRGNV